MHSAVFMKQPLAAQCWYVVGNNYAGTQVLAQVMRLGSIPSV